MPKVLKGIIATFGWKTSEETSSVEISRNGVVRINPDQLVRTKEVKQQIDALSRMIEKGQMEIDHSSKP